jgi:hypothetical protein
MRDIESFSNDDLIEELESRGYRMEVNYDLVDLKLYDDILLVFDSLNVFDRQRLRDYILNFK